jgi:hypothetical protein
MPFGEGVMRSLLMVMVGAALLGGCAVTTAPPMHWTKSGATQEVFLRDHFACRDEVEQDRFGYLRQGQTQQPYFACMQGRGYKQDSNGDLFVSEDVARYGLNGAAATAAAAANSATPTMNPMTAAASQDYSRAVADYRNCLTAHPSKQAACEGLRHIMDADAQVLSGSPGSSPSPSPPPPPPGAK